MVIVPFRKKLGGHRDFVSVKNAKNPMYIHEDQQHSSAAKENSQRHVNTHIRTISSLSFCWGNFMRK